MPDKRGRQVDDREIASEMERVLDLCRGRGNSSLDQRTSNVLGVHENTDFDLVLMSLAFLKRHGEYFLIFTCLLSFSVRTSCFRCWLLLFEDFFVVMFSVFTAQDKVGSDLSFKFMSIFLLFSHCSEHFLFCIILQVHNLS